MTIRLSLLFLCLILYIGAQGRSYPLYQIARKPVVDGKLDDYAWKRLPEGRGFHRLDKNSSYATGRTTMFKMGYTDKSLFIAVTCREPNLDTMKAVYSYRDGWVSDNAIEIFIQRTQTSDVLQLLCNAQGARWGKYRLQNHPIDPPGDWRAISGREQDGWTLEMEIPLSMLGLSAPMDMRFNICRNIPGEKRGNGNQTWAKLEGLSFHDSNYFAMLQVMRTNAPADIASESARINRQYDDYVFKALSSIRWQGKLWHDALRRCGSDKEVLAKLSSIRKKLVSNLYQLSVQDKIQIYDAWEIAQSFIQVPTRNLSFSVAGKAYRITAMYVGNTRVTSHDGNYNVTLKEGLNILSCELEAGQDASFHVSCPEFPELERRWAYSRVAPPQWRNSNYDDRSWKALTSSLPAGKVFLRQGIIWNLHHTGTMRCINPTVDCWRFSLDSTEPVYFSVYSPTGLPVDHFSFTFTLPQGFRLLEMVKGAKNGYRHLPPGNVAVQSLSHGIRYTLEYNPKDVHEWKTRDSVLCIRKDSTGKPGERGIIPYARHINANVTEIGGALPYVILPPINGRCLKSMIMNYYNGFPQLLGDECYREIIRDSLRAGIDSLNCNPIGLYRTGFTPDIAMRREKIRKVLGCKDIMNWLQHPILGSMILEGDVTRLFAKHPDLLCRYFDGSQPPSLDIQKNYRQAHELRLIACPSRVTGIYRDEFYQAVKNDFRNYFFKRHPEAQFMFFNWEQEPWCEHFMVGEDTSKTVCFCDVCKENFKEWAQLSKDTQLTNEIIRNDYYEPWKQFRYQQDAAVHKIIIQALEDLGKKAIFYSGSEHYGYWKAARDNSCLVFLGCPGNPTADRRAQVTMDNCMKIHRKEYGRKNIIGQRFVCFPQSYGKTKKKGWLKYTVLSDDGFIHPETWKWEIIRVIATLQGGIDLQCPLDLVSGVKYYIGEATRMIAEYERILYEGTRNDHLATSQHIAYPNMLVMVRGKERLVMLFNESGEPKTVTVNNLGLKEASKAHAFYQKRTLPIPAFTITIPPNDVEVVYIH